jgi:hypothetical protein
MRRSTPLVVALSPAMQRLPVNIALIADGTIMIPFTMADTQKYMELKKKELQKELGLQPLPPLEEA